MTIQTHTVYHNKKETKLAYVKKQGSPDKPIIVFCGGYRSDMQGTKALFLEDYAQKNGYGYIRFDYMGHGQSEGVFEEGTIGSWKQDAMEIIKAQAEDKDVILVGSSMGGWISLLCGGELKGKLKGLVGIAAAPDFTKDMVSQFSSEMKEDLAKKGYVELPNDYSPDPYIVTKALIDDGEENSLLHAPINITCPVVLLQSKKDTSVPWEKALKIKEKLVSENVEIILLDDGDHSLSRPQDLALLGEAIEKVA
ncbi:MAG: alpha/beta hydrolase [Bdellovibrionales bacterium]